MVTLTAEQLKGFLSERHPLPQWAFFTEICQSSTDDWFSKSRRIDAYAVSCCGTLENSQGLGWSIAYEIKISRSDFMNEIKDPSKRQVFIDTSNEFYYVTPQGLLKIDEIPENCGLIECDGSKLKVKKFAQQRPNLRYSPLFFASLCRTQDKRDPQEYKAFKYSGRDLSYNDLKKVFYFELKKLTEELSRDIKHQAEKSARFEINHNLSILIERVYKIMGFEKPYTDDELNSPYQFYHLEKDLISVCNQLKERGYLIDPNENNKIEEILDKLSIVSQELRNLKK